MDYSYAQPTVVHCAHCRQTETVDLWVILDQAARPELLQQLKEKTLNHRICSHCEQPMEGDDEPLLIYRPGQEPPLLFSPAPKTVFAEDQAHDMQRLVQHLLATLDDSDDDWVMEGLKRVPRHQLVETLTSG